MRGGHSEWLSDQSSSSSEAGRFYDTFLGLPLTGLPGLQVCVGVGLTLTNLSNGLEVWTKTVDMSKQGKRNSVGM